MAKKSKRAAERRKKYQAWERRAYSRWAAKNPEKAAKTTFKSANLIFRRGDVATSARKERKSRYRDAQRTGRSPDAAEGRTRDRMKMAEGYIQKRDPKSAEQAPVMVGQTALSPSLFNFKTIGQRKPPGAWDQPTYYAKGQEGKETLREAVEKNLGPEKLSLPQKKKIMSTAKADVGVGAAPLRTGSRIGTYTKKKKPYTLLPGFRQPRVRRPTLLRGNAYG